MLKFLKSILLILVISSFCPAYSQTPDSSASQAEGEPSGVTVLPPLFEYPTVPDNIEGWQERNNWLVEHFWDNFDFKQHAVGQAQLNHAFKTFTVPIRFADAGTSIKSVEKLVGKLKKQPGLLLQFTMAAEQVCYEPEKATAIIDEVYLPFLTAIHADKKLPAVRKARYEHQYNSLNGCLVGDEMKNFDYIDRNGGNTRFTPSNSQYTIIEFGDPGCSECRIIRIRLETDDLLKQRCTEGQAQVYFIMPDVEEDDDSWREEVKDYPHYWNVGIAPGIDEKLDLRITPCLYLIGPDRKIIGKNMSIDEIRAILKGEHQ